MSTITLSSQRRAADDQRTTLDIIAQAASATQELTRRLPADIDLVGIYIPFDSTGFNRYPELQVHAGDVQEALRVIGATGEIFTHTLTTGTAGIHHSWHGHWRGLLVAVVAIWKVPQEVAP